MLKQTHGSADSPPGTDPIIILAKTVDTFEQVSTAVLDSLARGRFQRVIDLHSLHPEAQHIFQTEPVRRLAEYVLLDRVSEGRATLVPELASLIAPQLLKSEAFQQAVVKGAEFLLSERRFGETDRFIQKFELSQEHWQRALSSFEAALIKELPQSIGNQLQDQTLGKIMNSEKFKQAGFELMQSFIRTGQYAELKDLLSSYPQFMEQCEGLKSEVERQIASNPLRTVPLKIREVFQLNDYFSSDQFQSRLESAMRAELLRDNLEGVAVLIRNYPVSAEVKANLRAEAEMVASDLESGLKSKEREQLSRVARNQALSPFYREYFKLDRELLAEVRGYFNG